jgi:hypothetical protein
MEIAASSLNPNLAKEVSKTALGADPLAQPAKPKMAPKGSD